MSRAQGDGHEPLRFLSRAGAAGLISLFSEIFNFCPQNGHPGTHHPHTRHPRTHHRCTRHPCTHFTDNVYCFDILPCKKFISPFVHPSVCSLILNPISQQLSIFCFYFTKKSISRRNPKLPSVTFHPKTHVSDLSPRTIPETPVQRP